MKYLLHLCSIYLYVLFSFAGERNVVLHKQQNREVVVGYLHSDRNTIHGKAVPLEFEPVEIAWVKEAQIPAPVILGDPEENRYLCVGQFFVLPRKDLTKVKAID